MKQILKIGDDCFSSVLACVGEVERRSCARRSATSLLAGPRRARRGTRRCRHDGHADRRPAPRDRLGLRQGGRPLRRSRCCGPGPTGCARGSSATRTRCRPTSRSQGSTPPASPFTMVADREHERAAPGERLVLAHPRQVARSRRSVRDFTLSCGNCHQIARVPLPSRQDRGAVAQRAHAHDDEPAAVLPGDARSRSSRTCSTPTARTRPIRRSPVPPPPSGEVLKRGPLRVRARQRDQQPGLPRPGARRRQPRLRGRGAALDRPAHERARPLPVHRRLAFDRARGPTGTCGSRRRAATAWPRSSSTASRRRYFPLPRIGDDQGAYPHTLRFDSQGDIWMTLTKSNQLALFDPPTAVWTYHPLPEADPAEVGLSIPVAYGCDVAPDDSVWWSQLFGDRIGHYVPATNTLKAWRPPFYGPRRLARRPGRHRVGAGLRLAASSAASIPRSSAGRSGRCRPVCPTRSGFGTSETPYNLNANRQTGHVWINGSNSDTLIRFEPTSQRFTAFPLPTRASFTREIEFDPDNNVWTCTSNEPPGPGRAGPRQVREARAAAAGRRVRQRPARESARSATTATRRLRRLQRAAAASRSAAATARAATARRATTATPTTATAARRRAASRPACSAATA